MDQFAEVMRRRRARRSCSTAGRTSGGPIPLPTDLALVVCHTGSPRHLDGSEYNVRRSQCDAAVAALALATRRASQPARRDPRDARRRPATASTRSPSPGPSTSSPRTRGSTPRSPRSRRATCRRSAGCSRRATRRSEIGSRSARRSSTRWSTSPRRSTRRRRRADDRAPGSVAARSTSCGPTPSRHFTPPS